MISQLFLPIPKPCKKRNSASKAINNSSENITNMVKILHFRVMSNKVNAGIG
jgi:hypothetical protein